MSKKIQRARPPASGGNCICPMCEVRRIYGATNNSNKDTNKQIEWLEAKLPEVLELKAHNTRMYNDMHIQDYLNELWDYLSYLKEDDGPRPSYAK